MSLSVCQWVYLSSGSLLLGVRLDLLSSCSVLSTTIFFFFCLECGSWGRMSYVGVGVSPGNVPVYHNTDVKLVDRSVRVAELVLRSVICALGVLAAVLVGTDTQVKEIFKIQKKARFTDMKALV